VNLNAHVARCSCAAAAADIPRDTFDDSDTEGGSTGCCEAENMTLVRVKHVRCLTRATLRSAAALQHKNTREDGFKRNAQVRAMMDAMGLCFSTLPLGGLQTEQLF
jgi:hypothetical protein